MSRTVYRDARPEKTARDAAMSAVKRVVGRDSVVIVDGLNYIKGYRYQLYCEAKAAQTGSCVVSDEGEGREGGWSTEVDWREGGWKLTGADANAADRSRFTSAHRLKPVARTTTPDDVAKSQAPPEKAPVVTEALAGTRRQKTKRVAVAMARPFVTALTSAHPKPPPRPTTPTSLTI